MTKSYNLADFATWTALITPFDELGAIDFDSLTQLVDQQDSAGNAILLMGSTGEGLAISLEDQLEVVSFVSNLNPGVPIMVAVGGADLPAQLTWMKHCNRLNIDAYLLGTPFYAKPGVAGQTHWFKNLLDAAKHPCMIYNVPSRSGVNIPAQTVANLVSHPNLWAMKEASGDIHQFLAYRQVAPGLAIYSGEDALMPYLAAAGAKGLVSVCSNVWPEATNLYVKKSLGGDNQSLFPVWYNATNALFSAANPIPVKVLMHLRKMIASPMLRAPLTHLELTDHQGIIDADKRIHDWHNAELKQHALTD
ncbi:4-hydroxy-tetrahydrodipicolinate synthase [Thalassotalea mangrovi]|uniref:4-hydroxy-tetrahydrodipicolinate synthase n=1 Tax=Thalassotalea mangrovi TaxID=2572245 RepID=A0A4U1BAF3_9GAMM|nr:4-hydroxy-tetrahydrodipicolinate synthase [Thalassotalea mangrovi]TKB47038.1 4-hydroxy-tetrahydrodipicolinate synthase [Thalassotalea mangrovi]